jgi:D-alanine transaminase
MENMPAIQSKNNMTRISYLNGEFLSHEKCFVHIEDRGFQFADGVYEVTLFENGKLIDGDAHMNRLLRSLREVNIQHDFSVEGLRKIMIELFAQNKMTSGTCYLQITRGHHARIPWCPKGLTPTINATVSERKSVSAEEFESGFTAITHEDIRWHRCDIKTVGLLASSLINQKAKDSGANDAIFVRNGVVTEGSFANLFIVDAAGNLVTKDADNLILCGITRNRLIELAQKRGIKTIEKKFGIEELMNAQEVFLTSSSLILRPVVKIDGKIIGGGKPGKIARILNDAYKDFIISGEAL